LPFYLPDLIALSDSSEFAEFITPYKEEMIERGKLVDYFLLLTRADFFFEGAGDKKPYFHYSGMRSRSAPNY